MLNVSPTSMTHGAYAANFPVHHLNPNLLLGNEDSGFVANTSPSTLLSTSAVIARHHTAMNRPSPGASGLVAPTPHRMVNDALAASGFSTPLDQVHIGRTSATSSTRPSALKSEVRRICAASSARESPEPQPFSAAAPPTGSPGSHAARPSAVVERSVEVSTPVWSPEAASGPSWAFAPAAVSHVAATSFRRNGGHGAKACVVQHHRDRIEAEQRESANTSPSKAQPDSPEGAAPPADLLCTRRPAERQPAERHPAERHSVDAPWCSSEEDGM